MMRRSRIPEAKPSNRHHPRAARYPVRHLPSDIHLPFLREAGKDPVKLRNLCTQLQCPLILNPRTRSTYCSPTRLSGSGSGS